MYKMPSLCSSSITGNIEYTYLIKVSILAYKLVFHWFYTIFKKTISSTVFKIQVISIAWAILTKTHQWPACIE